MMGDLAWKIISVAEAGLLPWELRRVQFYCGGHQGVEARLSDPSLAVETRQACTVEVILKGRFCWGRCQWFQDSRETSNFLRRYRILLRWPGVGQVSRLCKDEWPRWDGGGPLMWPIITQTPCRQPSGTIIHILFLTSDVFSSLEQ